MVLFLFSHILKCTNPSILLYATNSLFICFLYTLRYPLRQSKSTMINSFWIIFIKIIIIKANIIKVLGIKSHIIAKKCDNIRVYIMKKYIFIRKYSIIKFFSNYARRQVSTAAHTFLGSYINQGNILT